MRAVSKDQARQVVEMASQPGWAILVEVIQKDIDTLQTLLEQNRFGELSEVAYLQGQITAFREVINYPARRAEQLNKED